MRSVPFRGLSVAPIRRILSRLNLARRVLIPAMRKARMTCRILPDGPCCLHHRLLAALSDG